MLQLCKVNLPHMTKQGLFTHPGQSVSQDAVAVLMAKHNLDKA